MNTALALLVVANVVGWVIIPPPPQDASDQRTPAAVEQDLRLVLSGAAVDVEAWRASHGGTVPATLEVLGLADRGFEYTVVDASTFQLAGRDGAVHLTYRSTTPIAEFLNPGSGTKP